MKLVFSPIEKKILENLADGTARHQTKLISEFATSGSAPEYLYQRLRGMRVQGLIVREQREDLPGMWITITDSGREALALMERLGGV